MFLGYQKNKIKFYTEQPFDEPTVEKWEETEEEYVLDGDEYVLNDDDYKERQRQKERERKDQMTLTPADVERALYKAKGMDFADLKELIATQMTGVDLKALNIEFNASNFYRGAKFGNNRLFDVVGILLGYQPNQVEYVMDYLFEHKELPIENE